MTTAPTTNDNDKRLDVRKQEVLEDDDVIDDDWVRVQGEGENEEEKNPDGTNEDAAAASEDDEIATPEEAEDAAVEIEDAKGEAPVIAAEPALEPEPEEETPDIRELFPLVGYLERLAEGLPESSSRVDGRIHWVWNIASVLLHPAILSQLLKIHRYVPYPWNWILSVALILYHAYILKRRCRKDIEDDDDNIMHLPFLSTDEVYARFVLSLALPFLGDCNLASAIVVILGSIVLIISKQVPSMAATLGVGLLGAVYAVGENSHETNVMMPVVTFLAGIWLVASTVASARDADWVRWSARASMLTFAMCLLCSKRYWEMGVRP